MPENHNSEIYGCFVLFNPDDDHHLGSMESVIASGGRVVVFDNSDNQAATQQNRTTIAARLGENFDFLEQGDNIGLSAAFNRIAEHVIAKGDAEAIVVFDQDSTVTPEIFDRLVQGYRNAAMEHSIGVYAAYAVRVNGQEYRVRPVRNVKTSSRNLLPVQFAPSSFSLIPLDALRAVGSFQEDFFIDHIDVDFCRRLWKVGRVVLIDTELRFPHRIGEGNLFINGRAVAPISSPFRHYYQVRNIILSAQRGGSNWRHAIGEVIKRFVVIGVTGVQAGKFTERYGHALRGLRDGLMGRGGRMPKAR